MAALRGMAALLGLLAGSPAALAVEPLAGVAPARAAAFAPNDGGFFACADGAQLLPYAQLNDDYWCASPSLLPLDPRLILA